MTIRFFILQAHYRSTVDFSSEALEASEKGLERLTEGYARLLKISPEKTSTIDIKGLRTKCEEALLDDLNTPIVIAVLFEALKSINLVANGKDAVNEEDLNELKQIFQIFAVDLLGLQLHVSENSGIDAYKQAIDLLLNIRLEAKKNKDWATSDKIRNELSALGFEIKDTKDGFEWKI
jgi:cysteinyl-tRNA synthetase